MYQWKTEAGCQSSQFFGRVCGEILHYFVDDKSRDHKAALNYSKLLTSYAAEFVHKQLKLTGKVKEGQYIVDTSEGSKVVTSTTCGCIFHIASMSPYICTSM